MKSDMLSVTVDDRSAKVKAEQCKIVFQSNLVILTATSPVISDMFYGAGDIVSN